MYDAHGNLTTFGDQSLTYDSSDRHTATVTTGAGGATVLYTRDATDRMVSMTTIVGITSTTVHYLYTDGSDSPDWTVNATGTVLSRDYVLPGGVTVSIQNNGGNWNWSYPNIHGDAMLTTGGTGGRSGHLYLYDPFGQPLDVNGFAIGTNSADEMGPGNTTTTTTANGWEGSAQKQYQRAGDIATIEMGARQYVPGLGRFLSVDPVSGGNSNDYNYPNDPVDASDLTGRDLSSGHDRDYPTWNIGNYWTTSTLTVLQYDHIMAGHQSQYERILRYNGAGTVSQLVDFLIGNTLKHKQIPSYRRSNDTWNYRSIIKFYEYDSHGRRTTVCTQTFLVSVGVTSQHIASAYPLGKPKSTKGGKCVGY